MANDFTDDTLLARWLSGELSDAELKALRERPDFADYERLATAGSRLRVPEYDAAAELAKLQQRQAQEKVALKQKKVVTRRLLQPVHYWSAAVAAVLLVVAWVIWPESEQRIYASAGEPAKTTKLLDGSVVKLNAGSNFGFTEGAQRLGKLEGEGYFEVRKSDVPFVVETELGTVTVLGTQFNVYARDGEFRVACTEGKVSVSFDGVP
ncbi:MAG: FecR family protein, partial [Bacteroidota bacterium]